MSGVSTEELEKIMQVVEEASQNHVKWYDDLIRRLLCHLPLSESMMAADAHRRCAFGTWFYGIGKGQVQELEAFKQIGELHETMHNRARQVCLKIKATGHTPEADYDQFVQDLGEFRNALAQLRGRVAKTLGRSDAAPGA